VFFLNNENTVTLPGEKKTLLGNYFGSIFSRNIIIAYLYQQSFFFFENTSSANSNMESGKLN